MTLLPTVEAFPLELLLLRNSPFRSQLTIFPFVVCFLELGTLTMFHKVNLGIAQIVCPFLLKSPIVFFDAKSNNQIFDAHLLFLMLEVILEVILEVFQNMRQLLNNSCNLKIFFQHHSLNMNLMKDYLKFLDLTNHNLEIYHFVIKKTIYDKLVLQSPLYMVFPYSVFHVNMCTGCSRLLFRVPIIIIFTSY